MNEAEWEVSQDPGAMLTWLRTGQIWHSDTHASPAPRPSERKLRLYACGISWLGIDSVRPEESAEWRQAVTDAERFADGETPAGDMNKHNRWTIGIVERPDIVARHILTDVALLRRQAECAALLRDVVGNPFRPVTLPRQKLKCVRCNGKGNVRRAEIYASRWDREECDSCGAAGFVDGPCPWLTPQVVSLAHAAYSERNPDGTLDALTMMALSDALEETGCLDVAIHDHLRFAGPHVRGMWSLDIILGKS